MVGALLGWLMDLPDSVERQACRRNGGTSSLFADRPYCKCIAAAFMQLHANLDMVPVAAMETPRSVK
jgi:hypothetical protein